MERWGRIPKVGTDPIPNVALTLIDSGGVTGGIVVLLIGFKVRCFFEGVVKVIRPS